MNKAIKVISRIQEALDKSETNRLKIKVTRDIKRNATIFNGNLKGLLNLNKLAAEVMCEEQDDKVCYVGWINSNIPRKGYGSEILEFVIQYYRDKGFNKITAYVPTLTKYSKDMFLKAGFKVVKTRQNTGDNLELVL